MDRFTDDGKLGQRFTSADDLVEVDIGSGDRPRPTASAELDTYERTRCMSGEAWEKDFLKVADYVISPIQAVSSDEEF